MIKVNIWHIYTDICFICHSPVSVV